MTIGGVLLEMCQRYMSCIPYRDSVCKGSPKGVLFEVVIGSSHPALPQSPFPKAPFPGHAVEAREYKGPQSTVISPSSVSVLCLHSPRPRTNGQSMLRELE